MTIKPGALLNCHREKMLWAVDGFIKPNSIQVAIERIRQGWLLVASLKPLEWITKNLLHLLQR